MTDTLKRLDNLGLMNLLHFDRITCPYKSSPGVNGHLLVVEGVHPFRLFAEWNCRKMDPREEESIVECGEEIEVKEKENGDVFVDLFPRSVLRFYASFELSTHIQEEMKVSLLDEYAECGLRLEHTVKPDGRVLLTLVNPTAHTVSVYPFYGVGTASFYRVIKEEPNAY